jgi:YD repeat-containing protein
VRSQPNQTITCESENPALALVYDAHSRLVSVQDASGFRTFIYTVNTTDGGTTVQMITPGDVLFSWSLAYDEVGNLRSWTDESGITRVYTHDTLGRLRSVSVEGEPEASYTFDYNLAGLLTAQRDGLGRGSIYAYNAQGQVILRQDALTGDASSYNYDNRGLLVSLTSPLGSVTSYQYTDSVDPTRITGITTANGRDEFIWNDSANTLTYVDAGGRQQTYTFDSLGLLWQVSSPAGRHYNLVHDEMGRLTTWETEGESEHAIALGYDPAESLVTISEGTTPDWQWNFGFTAGQLSDVVNPAQQALGFDYDPMNRLANARANGELFWSQTFTDQSPQATLLDGQILSYDALYRRTQDGSTSYSYEASEDEGVVNVQIASPTDMQIYTLSSGDDRQPPRVALRSPGRLTLYTYNAEGQLESIDDEVCLQAPYFDLTSIPLAAFTIEDQSACESADSPNVWRSNVRILYDEIGQPIRIVDEEQAVEAFTYDGAGNLVSYQDQDGRTYNYAYDALYRLARLTTPVGVEMSLDYDLDRVAGICRSAGSADYAACVASGGTIETYTYDALGRLTGQSFPNGGATSSIVQEYSGGLLTTWADNRIVYAEDGFSTVERLNNARLSYTAGSLRQAGELSFSHDQSGRLTEISMGEQTLTFQYDDDNLGYSVEDSTGGGSMHFRLYPNGLLESVEYEGESVLSVEYFGQETDGILPFTLNWGDETLLDLRVNRRGEELFLDYVPMLADGLAADYVFSQRGNVARVVIASDDPAYFETGDAGYTIVLGYDQSDNPLTMRVTGASGNLLYQATYVYDTQAQLTREVREYTGGQRIQIDYTYADGGQLISRTVSQRGVGISTTSGFGLLSIGLIGAAGTLQMRRVLNKRLVFLALLALSILLFYVAVNAQDTGTAVVYTYAYDERGNLARMDANGDTCATYSYDDANHLTSVQSTVGTTEYGYDIFGRLASVDGTPLVYAGESPLLMASEHGARFYTVTNDGTQLFFTENSAVFPFVYGGWGQVFGTRSFDDVETSPVWLFDPFRRFLTLTPQVSSDLCASNTVTVNSNLLPVFQNALWDTRNNLLLINGRAYSPDMAQFLQRDPLGPDALGRVYEYASERSAPPVRLREPAYNIGLSKLLSVIALQELGWTLDSDTLAAHYLPQPRGVVESAFYDQLQAMPNDYRATLGGLVSLPSWLANDYNLPSARIDEHGGLRLLVDNAPGHGGWGDQSMLHFDNPIWENTVWSQSNMNMPLTPLSTLIGHLQYPANRLTGYVPTAWRGETVMFGDIWSVPSVDLSVDSTPAAVLALLPRPLSGYRQAEDVLALVQTLDTLPEMTNRDWLDLTLVSALPTLPDLPPADVAEWRREWFSTDTFGLMEILGERYPVSTPPDAALNVTVKVGGR